MKKTYQEQKEIARQKALDYEEYARENSMSWGELTYWQDYFTKLGKRYGLLEEFRENGIC